nr:hypothetical protein BaRGS_006028 [Batillaria attramentaria]
MVLPLVLSILAELSAHIAFAEPCGGMKGVYVCNPGNPTRFDICIGEQKYTMSCPGGLHFNARTQSPFAYKDRRAQSQPATKDGPATPGEQDRDDKKTSFKASAINKPEDFKASKNQVAQENDVNEKKTAQDPLPAQKTDRSYKKNSNYGDSEKKTIYNGNGNNFYGNDKNSNNNANNNINNNDNNINNNINNNGNSKRNDRFSLHHYPWWASRSSTPRSLRRRFPQPTMRPPRQYSQKRYQRPSGQNTKSGSQRGLAPSYQPAPAPRQSPPRHVPPRQPLSAAAAAAPPAKSITAAAASAPKRVKKPRKTGG